MFIVIKWDINISAANLFSTLREAVNYVTTYKKRWPTCAFYVKKINKPLFLSRSFIQTY